MIFIITTHPAGHATIDCPVAGNTLLHGTSAVLHNRQWYVEANQVDQIADWLTGHGHHPLVIADDPHPSPADQPAHNRCPHGIRWGHLLDDEHISIGGCCRCEWRDPDGNVTAPGSLGSQPYDPRTWRTDR